MIKRAIITGATGAIGTALIKELIANGLEVLVLTRKDSKRNGNIPTDSRVIIKYCSLDDLSTIKNDTGKVYDVFFHLAWSGTSGPGRNDHELQQKNVEYSLDAVRCAKMFGCHKFVGIGSQAEYGRKDSELKSDTLCNPENEYGKAKLEAGIKTRELANRLGMEHNWVRVLSIYGPNDNENSLISYAFRELKNGRSPSFTKGEQIWDYLYSEDAAKALFLIADKGVGGKTYVLGSGEGRPLKEYLVELGNVVSPKTKLNFGEKPYPDGQVMYLKADISELNTDTGWLPETKFAEGIRKMNNPDKLSSLIQFIKFGLVGVSNTAISLGIYYLCVFINKKLYLLGNILGFVVSVLNSFYWNNKYVFKTSGQGGWFRRLLKTYASYGGSTILSTILLYLEVEVLGMSEVISPLINMAITIPLNFIVNKLWAFKKEEK